ncbi:hypothetical protein BEN47_04790 [Hymenobacter lapidarius]|uniref:Uncharacterized protein n=1 Tax=Hymenobacter lapidarius TaxID=1908237 RepID=A0A1G1STJ7_9BACT|nr:hypothetical protein [Hymenobacter lapidarius]OGX81942.1 hypothetical protein BEN47_04790 [Hymenobacter lapidarius]
MLTNPTSEPAQPFGLTDADNAVSNGCAAVAAGAVAPRPRRLDGALVSTASRLLPLVELLDSLQPYVVNESVFRIRRRRIIAQIRLAQAQLKAEKPQRQALLHAFQTMGELFAHEIRDISGDEAKQAAREVVLATLRNAPGLISAAHQARQLS